jgi:hypothetical protein
VPLDGYLRHGRCFYRAPERLVHERVELRFDRDQVWIVHRGVEVARYSRCFEQGVWLPAADHATRAAGRGAFRAAPDRRRSAGARRLRGAVRVSAAKAKAGGLPVRASHDSRRRYGPADSGVRSLRFPHRRDAQL